MGLISTAYAETAAAQQSGGTFQLVSMLVIFGLIFYFMIFRPQSKRNKEQRALLASLAKGEEVLTSGGIVGKITKVSEDNEYVVIELNENNEITIKKSFIAAVLPKGTLASHR